MRRVVLYVGVAVALSRMLPAQTADLSGRIVDQSQLVLPGAIVEVTALATSQKRSTFTNDSGVYSLPDLAPGRYDITASAKGFSAQERHGFLLEVAQQAQVDFTLEVGPASETLNVNGGPDRLQTSDAAVSTIVERALTDNLPLNGRSFQNLITLAPGVNLSNAQNGSGQFVVNGMRATFNSFSIDGVNAVSTVTGYQSAGGNNASYNLAGGTNGMASVDAVDEFRILTGSFAPEFGRNPGAHVLVVTRSGTNQLHGSAFDHFRNDKLDAADWFVDQAGQNKPRLRANDFGGVLGGPIARDKMFFFLSYEGQRLTQPQFAVTSVPSTAARSSAPAVAQPFLNAFPLPNGPDLGNNHAQFAAGYSNPLQTDSILLKNRPGFSATGCWHGFCDVHLGAVFQIRPVEQQFGKSGGRQCSGVANAGVDGRFDLCAEHGAHHRREIEFRGQRQHIAFHDGYVWRSHCAPERFAAPGLHAGELLFIRESGRSGGRSVWRQPGHAD